MKALYDLSNETVTVREHPVAANTALSVGQMVQISSGKVTKVTASLTTAVLGIVAEPHAGSADILNPRANGTSVKVADSPSTVFACAAPVIIASGGTTTTIVSEDISGMDNDTLNGGFAVLVSKADASRNTDPIGTRYAITDYVSSSTTITISTAGGAVTSGDRFAVFLPFGAVKAQFTSDAQGITIYNGTAAALPLRVIGHDFDRNELHLLASKHAFANANA